MKIHNNTQSFQTAIDLALNELERSKVKVKAYQGHIYLCGPECLVEKVYEYIADKVGLIIKPY